MCDVVCDGDVYDIKYDCCLYNTCLMTWIIMIPITAQPDTDTATYSRKRSDMDGVLLLKTKVGDVCGGARWMMRCMMCDVSCGNAVWNVKRTKIRKGHYHI